MVKSFQKQCKLQMNRCKLLIELKCSNMQMSLIFDQFDDANYQLPKGLGIILMISTDVEQLGNSQLSTTIEK